MAATGNEVVLLSQLDDLKQWIMSQAEGMAETIQTDVMTSVWNTVFPVGTVIEVKQSAGTWDPASQFGGTWVLDEDTYLFAGIKRYWRTA